MTEEEKYERKKLQKQKRQRKYGHIEEQADADRQKDGQKYEQTDKHGMTGERTNGRMNTHLAYMYRVGHMYVATV